MIDCAHRTTTGTNTVRSNIDTDIHTVRIGLNYAFGPRAPPAAEAVTAAEARSVSKLPVHQPSAGRD